MYIPSRRLCLLKRSIADYGKIVKWGNGEEKLFFWTEEPSF